MSSSRRPLPRTIRGGRRFFFDDPAVDKLVTMLLALSGEVWVLRERLAAVEGVARAAQAFTTEDVERYEFSPEELERLGVLRREFIENLFRVLDERVEAAGATGTMGPTASGTVAAAQPTASRPRRKKSVIAKKVRTRSASTSVTAGRRGSAATGPKRVRRGPRR